MNEPHTAEKNLYRCPHCHKVVRRESTKAWINSACTETSRMTRIMRLDVPELYCEHDTYTVQHPLQAGWIVYCADCNLVSEGGTRGQAERRWRDGIHKIRHFDRGELVDRGELGE